MTPIEQLIKFLQTQDPSGIVSGDWDKLNFKIREDENQEEGGRTLLLSEIKIGFYFDKEGKFCGIYNYKE